VPFMVAGGALDGLKTVLPLPIRGSPRSSGKPEAMPEAGGGGQNAPLQAFRIRGGVERQESHELLLGRSTAAPLMAKVAAHRR
jgi:hypothetical protein